MPAPARIITNPVTGEHLTWLLTGEQTGGAFGRAEIRVHGAGRGSRVPHAHPAAHERFTVISGRLAIERDGALSVHGPGETITVEPGVRHAWWNARAGELCVHVEVSPPGRFEELTEVGFRWAREGRLDACGDPGVVLGAAFVEACGDEIEYPAAPRWIRRVVVPPLARLARRRAPEARACPRTLAA
jgi:quercetin dioxygenase-like cupin family protein